MFPPTQPDDLSTVTRPNVNVIIERDHIEHKITGTPSNHDPTLNREITSKRCGLA
jgi:hypothetical protein